MGVCVTGGFVTVFPMVVIAPHHVNANKPTTETSKNIFFMEIDKRIKIKEERQKPSASINYKLSTINFFCIYFTA